MLTIAGAGRVMGEVGLEFGESQKESPIKGEPEAIHFVKVRALRGACAVKP